LLAVNEEADGEKPDILAALPPDKRIELMRDSCFAVLGKHFGGMVWQRMHPLLTFNKRQFGDAPEPKDNYWQGAWQIYSAD